MNITNAVFLNCLFICKIVPKIPLGLFNFTFLFLQGSYKVKIVKFTKDQAQKCEFWVFLFGIAIFPIRPALYSCVTCVIWSALWLTCTFLKFFFNSWLSKLFRLLIFKTVKTFLRLFLQPNVFTSLFKLISSIQFYLRTLESGLYRNSARLDN